MFELKDEMSSEFIGLGQGGGDRFLHQDMEPGLQGPRCKRKMRLRRGRDHHRVAGRAQGLPVQRPGADLPGHRGGVGRVEVVHAGQRGPRRSGDLQRMEAPEMPCPDDADPQACHRDRLFASGPER